MAQIILRLRVVALLVSGLAFALFFAVPATAQETKDNNRKTAPSQSATHPASSDYVGSDTCATCHAEQVKHFRTTTMGRAFASHPKNDLEKLDCEACHGPGKIHAESGGGTAIPVRFTKNSTNTVEEKNSACLSCHTKGNRLFWEGSPHESRRLACVDCHTGHEPQPKKLSSDARFSSPLSDVHTLKKEEPELCLTCHQMRRAQLQRSSHMPYREGKVTCSSCHNPHGSPNPKQLLQATTNENCLSCHTERRGPFLWNHPPVLENCATCHEPHGTNNPQLLKVRMPRVCDTCHDASRHPTTPTLLNSIRDFNRGCTNCHSAIHGSNHPSGEKFLR